MQDRQTPGFRLRPLETADLTQTAGWFHNVADLACFDRSARVPLNRSGMEQAWHPLTTAQPDPEKCWFAIDTASGSLCGITGLEKISAINRDAIAALFIEETMRSQGIGIRAMALLLDFAFRQIGLNRVTSYYRADNNRSKNLTERSGFTIEGRMRKAWFAEGRFIDMITVGLLREEWQACRKGLAQELDTSLRISFQGAETSGWGWPPGPADAPEG